MMWADLSSHLCEFIDEDENEDPKIAEAESKIPPNPYASREEPI